MFPHCERPADSEEKKARSGRGVGREGMDEREGRKEGMGWGGDEIGKGLW